MTVSPRIAGHRTVNVRYKAPQRRQEVRAPIKKNGALPGAAPTSISSLTAFPHHRRLTCALPPV